MKSLARTETFASAAWQVAEDKSTLSYLFSICLRLTTLVFPVPRLAFRNPLYRGLHTRVSRCICLRFGDPFHIIAPFAGSETFKYAERLLVLLQSRGEIGRNRVCLS